MISLFFSFFKSQIRKKKPTLDQAKEKKTTARLAQNNAPRKKTKNDSIHQKNIIHGIKDNDVSSNINVWIIF
jgi:hypothetical protein